VSKMMMIVQPKNIIKTVERLNHVKTHERRRQKVGGERDGKKLKKWGGHCQSRAGLDGKYVSSQGRD